MKEVCWGCWNICGAPPVEIGMPPPDGTTASKYGEAAEEVTEAAIEAFTEPASGGCMTG